MKYARRILTGVTLAICAVTHTIADAQSLPSAQNRQFAELIAFFSGQWDCNGHFSNGTAISSTESFSALMSGAWLQQVHHDRPPHGYHAYSMWGIDKASQDLVVTIHDVAGGVRLFRSSDWRETSFRMESQTLLGIGDSNERFTYVRKNPATFTFAYSIRKASGEWVTGDELECQRSALPAT